MQRVLGVMKGSEFHKAVAALPGYVASSSGIGQHRCRSFSDSVDAETGRCPASEEALNWARRSASASSAASRSASAMSSMVLALKNGSSGVVGHVTVASL